MTARYVLAAVAFAAIWLASDAAIAHLLSGHP